MKKIVLFTLCLLFIGCASQKKVVYVPVQGENIIEYRDSIIHIKDTIKIPIPVERIVEVVPELDTSRLETSVAISEAFLDTENRKLRHTLRNKETALKGKLDTIVRIEYINKYIEKVVVEEVPVEVPYIPKFMWWIVGYAAVCAVFSIIKIILKLKSDRKSTRLNSSH